MNCPFCHAANPATSRACRVCGGPLGAAKPVIAPAVIIVNQPVSAEIARRNFDENIGELIGASFIFDENPRVCLVRNAGIVQFWNSQNDEISSFSVARRFRKLSPICCALLAPAFVAMGHENGEVRWHNFDARGRKSPAPHVGRVLALASNETHFYSGGSDGVIWATETNDNKAKSRALIEGLGALTTFAASPDANLIAVGCDDGAVCLWRFNEETAAFKLDWTRSGHNARVVSVAFSPNGQMIVSRDKAGVLCLWAAQTSYQLPLPTGAQTSHVPAAFSSDNRLLALANSENSVAIYDVALGTLICEMPPFAKPIAHLAFSAEATWLLVAGARQIAVWNVV